MPLRGEPIRNTGGLRRPLEVAGAGDSGRVLIELSADKAESGVGRCVGEVSIMNLYTK